MRWVVAHGVRSLPRGLCPVRHRLNAPSALRLKWQRPKLHNNPQHLRCLHRHLNPRLRLKNKFQHRLPKGKLL